MNINADFIRFNGFKEANESFFYNNINVISFFEKAYYESNHLMDEITCQANLHKDLRFFNENFEKEQVWTVSIQQVSENNFMHGISSIYVHPDHRNKGYGSQAIEALKYMAKQTSLPIPFLFAVHDSQYTEELNKFYLKNGLKRAENKEYCKAGMAWYRYFWAFGDFSLIYDDNEKKTNVQMLNINNK